MNASVWMLIPAAIWTACWFVNADGIFPARYNGPIAVSILILDVLVLVTER